MLSTAVCRRLDVRGESAAEAALAISLLTDRRTGDHVLPDELIEGAPVGTLDPSEQRLAGERRLRTAATTPTVSPCGVPASARPARTAARVKQR